MPRQARFLEPRLPYHITQRGNYKQDVFADDEDRHKYLNLLHFYSGRYHLEVWGFCLMDNHVHLIAYPENAGSLSHTLAVTHMCYAQHLHRKTGISGHLWQGRFFSCALDDNHLIRAMRYLEMNPVRAKLVTRPEDWPWSSARHHLGLTTTPLLKETRWPDNELLADWSNILALNDTDAALDGIRLATRTGRPLGSDAWINELEQRTGRKLRPRKPGRRKMT